MVLLKKCSLAALLLAGVSGHALAADLPEPPVVEPPPAAVDYTPAPAFGGWYIRGDVDYHWNDFRGADYYTYRTDPGGCGACGPTVTAVRDGHLDGKLDNGWSIGGGVGYQITDYLRADVTADYYGDADFEGHTHGTCGTNNTPCTSNDNTTLSTWLLLANAYADLYTYKGFTLYGGAGIGGAHVKWDKLTNSVDNTTAEHDGHSEWRFAYALMAGTSYCLTDNLDLDVGYRFSRVQGGDMFGYKSGGGPGFDNGFNVHEVRAGLRYNFGGKTYRDGCSAPPAPEPQPEPVYK